MDDLIELELDDSLLDGLAREVPLTGELDFSGDFIDDRWEEGYDY